MKGRSRCTEKKEEAILGIGAQIAPIGQHQIMIQATLSPHLVSYATSARPRSQKELARKFELSREFTKFVVRPAKDHFSAAEWGEIFSMNSRIILLVRVIVGSMFLLSGGGKLISPSKATGFAADLLPIQLADAGLLVLALSLFEVSLGLLLYIGKWPHIVAFVSCMLLLFFTALALATPNIDSSCGCFGDLISIEMELAILPRNLTLLILSLFVLRSSSNPVATKVVNKNG